MIQVYPNPAESEINIQLEPGATFEIHTLFGEKILNGVTGSAISIDKLLPGMYIIKSESVDSESLLRDNKSFQTG